MQQVLKKFLSRFFPRRVDAIVSDLTKISRELVEVSQAQAERERKFYAKAVQAHEESARAKRVAGKVAELVA